MKKLVALALSLCIILLTFSVAFSAAGIDDSGNLPRYKGDVNGDGKINIFDIIEMRDHIFGKNDLIGLDFNAADVNCDGKVDIFDIMEARDCVFGKKDLPQSIPFEVGINEPVRRAKFLDEKIVDSFENLKEIEQENPPLYSYLTERYNETFFEENALIFKIFTHGSSGYKHCVNAVIKKNDTLFLDVTITNPYPGVDIFTSSILAIEVKKADIVGVTDVKVLSNGEDIDIKYDRIISIDEDFKEDRVIITLKHAYSTINNFTPDDFPGLNVKDITYLFDPSTACGETFHQIIEMTFYISSKEHVLWAISQLEMREDVLAAEPDFNYIPVRNTNK